MLDKSDMATKNASGQQIAMNGTTSGWDPTTQDEITLALAQNGGLKRIQAAFKQRLDEAGWSQDLREYVTRLFRNGAATTYDDALAIVMKNINSDGAGVNGTTDGSVAPDLSIPNSAAEGGAEAVKKELKQIVVQKK